MTRRRCGARCALTCNNATRVCRSQRATRLSAPLCGLWARRGIRSGARRDTAHRFSRLSVAHQAAVDASLAPRLLSRRHTCGRGQVQWAARGVREVCRKRHAAGVTPACVTGCGMTTNAQEASNSSRWWILQALQLHASAHKQWGKPAQWCAETRKCAE